MNDSLNFRPCSNEYHGDRLEFLEIDNVAMFVFEPIDSMPKEPLLKYYISATYETYVSLNYTLTCCYNLHVMLIMDSYVYNKFCKSRSYFVLGQANEYKEAHVGRRSDFH
jgi:hypothetical protein